MLDFVCGLLQEKPRRRHSADESLQHGFFQAQLDDALVPAAAVPDLATQIYNPNPQRDYTNEYLDMQRRSAEEDMPDTLWLGPDPEDMELQEARADNLDDAPQAGSVDLQSLSVPTVPQARRRSSRSSSLSIHGHKGHHEREPSMRSSGSRRAKRHKGKHAALALTAETELSRPTDQLYVIEVYSRRVTMDEDFRVNASQLYSAAVQANKLLAPRKSQPALRPQFGQSSYHRRFKELDVIYKKPGDSSSWLPFRHGYFLSQALGLESKLAALFSRADEAPPKHEENFLIWEEIWKKIRPPRIIYDGKSVQHLKRAPTFLTEPGLDENPGADDVGHKDDSEGQGVAQSQVRFI